MSETPDRGQESSRTTEVATSAQQADVTVKKVATLHGEGAVAVYLTIHSSRAERCTVTVTDSFPAALRGQEVEFHPNYDPVNWSRGDGGVVYSTTLTPDEDRTTVYGVTIDDPAQLEQFDAEPAVEVIANRRPRESTDAEDAADVTDDDAFDFGPPGGDSDDGATERSRESVTAPADDDPSGDMVERTVPDDDSVIGAFVAELDRRELSDEERATIREALHLAVDPAVDARLQSLQEAVDALEETVEREVRTAPPRRRERGSDSIDQPSDE
jgi:hypothetical protein